MVSFFCVFAANWHRWLFCQCEKWFPFFDEISCKLARGAASDVLRRVDCAGRDKEYVAGLESNRGFAFEPIFERPLKNVDDFFPRMRVPGEENSGVNIDAGLDDRIRER